MLPIGPLMVEHRLIERMIGLIEKKLELATGDGLDAPFVEKVIVFIRTYADRCHHGKEEDILFHALAKKEMGEEHTHTLEELVAEHALARGRVASLEQAVRRMRSGDPTARADVHRMLKDLVDLYPRHIDKEDKRFFIPVMGYFTDDEKNELLHRGKEFDRALVHEIFRTMVEDLGG
jgi:hemerythrin-like domain-containing protein